MHVFDEMLILWYVCRMYVCMYVSNRMSAALRILSRFKLEIQIRHLQSCNLYFAATLM